MTSKKEMSPLEKLSREMEFFETEEWAADAMFDAELLTPLVVDAGAGRGMLSAAAERRGYSVLQVDKVDWARHGLECYKSKHGKMLGDFLKFSLPSGWQDATVIMNPPFSKAVDFVVHALEKLNARKVLCFQRLAWRESEARREFWEKYPPIRTYTYGSRATCWRGDLIKDVQAQKVIGSTPTPHALFVWERGQPLNGLGALYKPKLSVKLGDLVA